MVGLGTALAPFGAVAQTQPATAAPTGEPGPPICEVATVVEFKAGSAVLSSRTKASLDRVALKLNAATKERPGSEMLRLRGSVPPASEGESAVALATRRVDAVKGYLSERGVPPTNISVVPTGGAGDVPPLVNPQAMEIVSCATTSSAAPRVPSGTGTASTGTGTTAGAAATAAGAGAVTTGPATPPMVSTTPVPGPNPPLPTAGVPVPIATQDIAPPPEMPPAPPPLEATVPPGVPQPQQPMTKVGVGAMVGGGVTGFMDQQTRAFTDPGGSWEARASVGTRLPLALEAAYLGSAQNISALGLASAAKLVGNGAEATARFNFTRRAIQPYVFAGMGWTHYQITNAASNTSSLRDNDDVLTVPAGVGVSFRLAQSLLLDVRGTARATFNDDMLDGPYANTGQDARLHSWNAGARLGWEF
jgi:opacity protein-like surface antigen